MKFNILRDKVFDFEVEIISLVSYVLVLFGKLSNTFKFYAYSPRYLKRFHNRILFQTSDLLLFLKQ